MQEEARSSLPLAGRVSAKRRVGVGKSELSTPMKSAKAATAPETQPHSPGQTTPTPPRKGEGEGACRPGAAQRSPGSITADEAGRSTADARALPLIVVFMDPRLRGDDRRG